MYFFRNMVRIVNLSFVGFMYKNYEKHMDLQVLPLHKYPQYTMDCCKLINSEWQRSETARLRSLECSTDNLPTCLILLKDGSVIGHCKLSPIPSIPEGCFVESVVIEKSIRGQGYGKYLMEKAEEYCGTFLNLKVIYLSTKGQEIFYAKLGYNICEPISIYGFYIPNNKGPNSPKNISLSKSPNSKTYMNKYL